MKRFDLIKTIQMILVIITAAAGLTVIFSDGELYALIAANAHVRSLCILLWVLTGMSFLFLFYDFNSYSQLRRENTELDNAVHSDALTGIANRYSADVYLSRYLGRPLPEGTGCMTLNLVNLSELNAVRGHNGGDAAIRAFSDILLKVCDGAALIGRNGGNKFLVIFEHCTDRTLTDAMDQLNRQLDAWNSEHADLPLRISTGLAFHEPDVTSMTELVALSDHRASVKE